MKPMTGDVTIGMMTLSRTPCHSTALVPTATRVAPTRPPKSACDELDGRPKYQVIRFQTMAPTSAARMTVCESSGSSTMPLPTVSATFSAGEGADHVEDRRHDQRHARRQRARRHRRGDGVGGVVEAVREVEDEGDDDDEDEDEVHQVFFSTILSRMLATVFTLVDRLLERLVDVLPLDDVGALHVAVEELGDRVATMPVAVVLEAVDLDRSRRAGPCASRACRWRSRRTVVAFASTTGLLDRVGRGLLDAVEDAARRPSASMLSRISSMVVARS